ncbi:MAG: hypothetical protein QOK49_4001 [Baekduia sp.]|nr:hypothetical protein [Baekduia sp.]
MLVVVLTLAGCAAASRQPGAGHPAARRATVAATPLHIGAATACGDVVATTLRAIARRIYAQAAHGANVQASLRRLHRSTALAAAVRRGDAAATRAAVIPLLKHQIHRIIITRGSRVLATIHGAPALAPVHGILRDAAGVPVGRFVLAVANQTAIARITQTLTGAPVTLSTSSAPAPAAARTVSYSGTAFPRGRLRVRLAIGARALQRCGPTARATVAATVGAIGERLAHAESSGSAVVRVLQHVATDPGFRAAVANDDPAALRTAIIRFFRTRSLHVVRIRATTADGRLVGDVGGPYVLSPATTTVRDTRGRVLGHVTLSVQDDTGFIKLMHRFTGAAVILQTPAGTVPGSSLRPAPPAIPTRGTLTARGRLYDTYTFAARAFPDGPLSVALLLPRT